MNGIWERAPQRRGSVKRVLLAGMMCGALVACSEPAGPGPAKGQVRFEVRFSSTPVALATLTVTLKGPETVTFDLRQDATGLWTADPVTVTAGTYTVEIEGRDAAGVLTYEGKSTVVVSPNVIRSIPLTVVCVNTACHGGALGLTIMLPQPEAEPNGSVETAQQLTVQTFDFDNAVFRAAAVNGAIEPSDEDFFSIGLGDVAVGDSIFVYVFASQFGSTLHGAATLYDPAGNAVTAVVPVTGSAADTVIAYPVASDATAATYKFSVRSQDNTTGFYTVYAYLCKPAVNEFCRT